MSYSYCSCIKAAYDALLRHLGIDLPRANNNSNAGFGALDANAAGVASSGSGSFENNGNSGTTDDDTASSGAMPPSPLTGSARASSAPEFMRHSSMAGIQSKAEAKHRRSSVGMGSYSGGAASMHHVSEDLDRSDTFVAVAAFPAAAKAAAARHRTSAHNVTNATGGLASSIGSRNSSANLLRSVNSMASMPTSSSPRLAHHHSSLNLGFNGPNRHGSGKSLAGKRSSDSSLNATSGYPPPLKLPMPLPPPQLRERTGAGGNGGGSPMVGSSVVSDPSAQLRLGLKSLQQGKFAAAHGWFRKAADQGDASACFEVARLHDVGLGLQGTPAEIHNNSNFAGSSSSSGRSRRGSNYSVTGGVPQRNLPGAAYWYDAAARLGDGRAMYRLACWHTSGEGVPRNEGIAKVWMAHAAAAGVADAQYADACVKLQHAARLPPRLAEQRRLDALPSLRAASEQGHGPAALELGKLHRAAALVASKAAAAAASAAKSNADEAADSEDADVDGSTTGGVLLLEAGSEDRATALRLFEQAANCSASVDVPAGGDLFALDQDGSSGNGGSGGVNHEDGGEGGGSGAFSDVLPASWNGMGVSEDAAAQCRAEAQYEVARMHRETSARITEASANSSGGAYGDNDFDLVHGGDALMSALESTSLALSWMTQAAEDGHPDAMFDLSFM